MNPNEAERFVKFWMEWHGYNVHQAKAAAARVGKKVFTFQHDLWKSADLVGVHPLERNWVVQVTVEDGGTTKTRVEEVSKRRRKLIDTAASLKHNLVCVASPKRVGRVMYIELHFLLPQSRWGKVLIMAQGPWREFRKRKADRQIPVGFGGGRAALATIKQ